jgi:tRNA(Ile)-lysidine synthase
LLDEIADADLVALRDGEALHLPRLRGLAPARRVNAIRRWLHECSATLPPSARLTEALRQMLEADGDQLPAIVWDRYALRRYRDRIFLSAAEPPRLRSPLTWHWRDRPTLELGAGLGKLQAVTRPGGLKLALLRETLCARPRAGGEVLKPARRAATQSVQHLCQNLGVLPWMRDALPFICTGGELLGIADLWLDARWCEPGGERGLAFQWDGAPNFV